ncbi:hypothetical protein FRC11_003784, partial [Ceratobasidium sp. 423]
PPAPPVEQPPRPRSSHPKKTLGKAATAFDLQIPQANQHSTKTDNTVKLSSNGQIMILDTLALSTASEDSLPFDKWLLSALAEHPALAKEVPQWELHFNCIMSKPMLTTYFPVYWAYDIHVCKQALTTDIDPGTEHKDILNPLMAEFYAKMAQASLSALPSLSTNPGPSMSNMLPNAFYVDNGVMEVPNPVTVQVPSTSPAEMGNGSSHLERGYATYSMPPKVVSALIAPLGTMCAPYVVTNPTWFNPAGNDPWRIITPLIPNAWESELRGLGLWDGYLDVPAGLWNGFCLGVSSPIPYTHIPKNHKSATKKPSVITQHIEKETAAGCYTGPFTPDSLASLIRPFHIKIFVLI